VGVTFQCFEQGLNFSDKHREIRLAKAHLWCRDAIVLDVWRHMLVVGM